MFPLWLPVSNPAGLVFHPQHFTCKATGTKLTLKNAVIATDPATGEKDVYLRGKEPVIKPNQVMDVIAERVAKVPDSSMRTGDKKLNISGAEGSSYGAGAVAVTTATTAQKPAAVVGNVNKMEVRNNGTDKFAGAEAPAEEEASAAE